VCEVLQLQHFNQSLEPRFKEATTGCHWRWFWHAKRIDIWIQTWFQKLGKML